MNRLYTDILVPYFPAKVRVVLWIHPLLLILVPYSPAKIVLFVATTFWCPLSEIIGSKRSDDPEQAKKVR
jgi:hypothetical protein